MRAITELEACSLPHFGLIHLPKSCSFVTSLVLYLPPISSCFLDKSTSAGLLPLAKLYVRPLLCVV